jgi:cytochrome c553
VKKLLLTTTLTLSTMIASTTMCIKKNHNDPSNIESQKFDNGECAGKYSINEMKTKGWSIKDIQIKNDTYIYILSKENSQAIDYNKISASLDKYTKQDIRQKELIEGEKYYQLKCQSCHGLKGELKAFNSSRPLNTLSFDAMKESIRGYEWGEYNRGMALVMEPYARMMVQEDLRKIYIYLQHKNNLTKSK